MKFASTHEIGDTVVGSVIEAPTADEALRKILASVPTGVQVSVTPMEVSKKTQQETVQTLLDSYVDALHQRAAFKGESKVPQGVKTMCSKRHNKLLRALDGDEEELQSLVKIAQSH